MAKKKKNARSRQAGAGTGGYGTPSVGTPGTSGGMGNLMSQMTKLQDEMAVVQDELAEEELTVTAGGGMISVVITGQQDFKSIKIDPDAVDPEDVEMLEDLVLAAVIEAMTKAQELSEERMGALTGGMGLPPGMGL